ncbi:MAG: flagellar M-ring protein FliF [Candidatus Brocadiaceae bacterium]|nr:flagellar M-ring protein FliF [Candidatus Brocadiaceae bacterium]
MGLDIKNSAGQFTNIWNGISFPQKFIMILLTLSFIGGIVGVTQWARKPDYGLLYGDLDPKESSQIVEKLKEAHIPYKITSNGTMILISNEHVHEMRMKLASEGLPREESGYEILDKVSFGTSDFIQKINYRRAIQGELAKTIEHLDYVDWAQVHLAVPESSLFVEEEKPVTASVILKVRTGGKLKEEKVASIVHLVSASVEGLETNNVTVTDTRGNLLSKKKSMMSMTGTSNDELDIRMKIEDYYVVKAQELLEKIVGPGKAVVRVSADLDFKHVDEKRIEFDPEKRVPRVQTVTTRVSGGSPFSGGGGIAGMQANLNLSQSGIIQSAGSSEEEETAQTQYELSKLERVVSDHGASLKRLSVAVLLDGSYEETVSEDGEVQRTYIPRSRGEMERVAALVKQAMGIDESNYRNDSFEIQNIQFHEPDYKDEAEKLEGEQKKEFIIKVAKNGSLGITVIAFLLFVMKSIGKMKNQKENGLAVSSAQIKKHYEAAKGRAGKRKAMTPEEYRAGKDAYMDAIDVEDDEFENEHRRLEAEALAEEKRLQAEEKRVAMMREQVVKMVKKSPSVTAGSLKRWIVDDTLLGKK